MNEIKKNWKKLFLKGQQNKEKNFLEKEED